MLCIEWTDTSLRYRHWRMCFERLLQAFARWQPGNLFDIAAQPILEYRELIVIHNCPCEHSSKLQLSIRFTPSRCLDVRQDWYPMYYPEGMKARVIPVQSIEPHRIVAPTRDLNREPLGPQSRVVATKLPLHTHCILWVLIYLANNVRIVFYSDDRIEVVCFMRGNCGNTVNLNRNRYLNRVVLGMTLTLIG